MMGKKKLAAIRADVTEEIEKSGLDPEQWLAERLRKLQSERKADPRALETLRLLREALKSTDHPAEEVDIKAP